MRDKKGFFNEQWTKTEENNRRGETRGLLKKLEISQENFNAKIGIIKDRNG